MTKSEDIVIVGGGPAGAYCGYELAKKGIETAIFDQSHPRDKPCGGRITPLAFEKFPELKKIVLKEGITTKFKVITCSGKEVIIPQTNRIFGEAINVSRKYLDKELLEMAEENGAKLLAEKVLNIKKEHNSWRIKTKKGTIIANLVIGADGVNSIVRLRTAGPISSKNLALTYSYIGEGIDKEYSIVKFLADFPGYIWVFPWRNNGSVGIGSEIQYRREFSRILDEFIKFDLPKFKITSKFYAKLPKGESKFFSIPCAGKDWILVGDAAGHVDPITGEGILYALWSGKLAAKAIIRNEIEKYDDDWRQEYGDKLVEQAAKRDLFYNPFNIELLGLKSGSKGT